MISILKSLYQVLDSFNFRWNQTQINVTRIIMRSQQWLQRSKGHPVFLSLDLLQSLTAWIDPLSLAVLAFPRPSKVHLGWRPCLELKWEKDKTWTMLQSVFGRNTISRGRCLHSRFTARQKPWSFPSQKSTMWVLGIRKCMRILLANTNHQSSMFTYSVSRLLTNLLPSCSKLLKFKFSFKKRALDF